MNDVFIKGCIVFVLVVLVSLDVVYTLYVDYRYSMKTQNIRKSNLKLQKENAILKEKIASLKTEKKEDIIHDRT